MATICWNTAAAAANSCSRIPTEEKVRRVILAMHDACLRHGKRLEVRSYNQLPAHQAVMLKALRGLPADIRIVTKNTVVDFRGTDYPENPMLGAFPGQPELLELTACPEGSGYGYIPALLGGFYKDEIGRVAVDRKLAGVALRDRLSPAVRPCHVLHRRAAGADLRYRRTSST